MSNLGYRRIGVGVAAVGLVAGALNAPGVAHADTTVTVQQICTEDGADLVPMTVVAAAELSCGDPAYWAKTGTAPGLFIAPPPSLSRVMARLHQGSFSTDPANPWADWIIPSGSQPAAPPTPAPMIACDRTHCGPDVPIPCFGPGSPC